MIVVISFLGRLTSSRHHASPVDAALPSEIQMKVIGLSWARRLLVILFVWGIVGCAHSQKETTQVEQFLLASQQPPQQTPIQELSAFFRENYRQARKEASQALPSTIILEGGTLTLRRPSRPDAIAKAVPPMFHTLKGIAHLPLAMFVLLRPSSGQQGVPEPVLSKLVTLSQTIAKAKGTIGSTFPNLEQAKRQRLILEYSERVLMEVIKSRSVAIAQLVDFAKAVGPLIAKNAFDAGYAQVQEMHKVTMSWKTQMGAAEWASLAFVNRGSHQARYRNAATQYFSWVLGDASPEWSYPGESMRVVYAEGLVQAPGTWEELLVTVRIDAEASLAFFGDRWKLSEDVLAEGADQAIKDLR